VVFFRPHFVRDYRRMVRTFVERYGRDEAMERAVGGGGDAVGSAHLAILRDAGLRDTDYLIDVGCGTGRTAMALRDRPGLRYLGTDVVPELLAHARDRVGRPDWRFEVVDRLVIPEADGAADMVTMFSVLTHLSAREGRKYLAEAVRVLRPGGRAVISFLDSGLELHRQAAGGFLDQLLHRWRGTSVKNVVLDRREIESWARDLRLGLQLHGPERIGQSYCVFTKPGMQA
jgi:ubiquinone/menaquinone biosynthesis C-methylase UbiE